MKTRTFIFLCVIVGSLISGWALLNWVQDENKSDQPKVYKVGILTFISDQVSGIAQAVILPPLKNAMTERGYTEGHNVEYVIKRVNSKDDLNLALQDLSDAQIDVLYTIGPESTLAAISFNSSIPIVFQGISPSTIEDLTKNMPSIKDQVTGIMTFNTTAKRFQLLMQMAPGIKTVYLPYDPTSLSSFESMQTAEELAQEYGLTLIKQEFTDTESALHAATEIPDEADAIFAGIESEMIQFIPLFIENSLYTERKRLLTIPAGYTDPNILMCYGEDINKISDQAARLIDQILRGTSPSALPIESADAILLISMGAAEVIGLKVPTSVLDQADVIMRVSLSEFGTEPETVGGFCDTVLTTPMGTARACVTQACASLQDTTLSSYGEREDVSECSSVNLIGICKVDETEVYFYEGEAAAWQGGCQLGGGSWRKSAE
jgi:ABC-type uncharacterized transport system substrate-binding protein